MRIIEKKIGKEARFLAEGVSNEIDKQFVEEITEFYYKVKKYSKGSIIRFYCFKNELVISDDCLSILYSVFFELVLLDYKITFNKDMKNLTQRLNFINFLSTDKTEFKVLVNKKKKGNIEFGYVDYKKADKKIIAETCYQIVSYINKLIGKEEIPDEIETPIGESFFNAFEHSNNNFHYFTARVKRVESKINMCYTIIDFGQTIPIGVQKHIHKIKLGRKIGEIDAMKWALKEGNTIKVDEPGGNGFTALKDIVDSEIGKLLVFSSKAIYRRNNKEDTFSMMKKEFPGSIVHIDILFEPVVSETLSKSIEKVLWYGRLLWIL